MIVKVFILFKSKLKEIFFYRPKKIYFLYLFSFFIANKKDIDRLRKETSTEAGHPINDGERMTIPALQKRNDNVKNFSMSLFALSFLSFLFLCNPIDAIEMLQCRNVIDIWLIF